MANNSKNKRTYDAIVVGTGISGGWAAKELCEKGLNTLVLDRGKMMRHGDYPHADKDPWEYPNNDKLTIEERKALPMLARREQLRHSNKDYFMTSDEQPFHEEKPMYWLRGDQVGGRSLNWGRQTYRWSPMDFEANAKEGVAIPWPIGYEDLAPWYDYVERYIGVSGQAEGLAQVPDGQFLPPMSMNVMERYVADKVNAHYGEKRIIDGRCANLSVPHGGRGPCQYRNRCDRGCPYAGYFCSLSSTLPAADATGNMTLLSDQIVTEVLFDHDQQKASGVLVYDKSTATYTEYYARIVFLNASAFGTTQILLQSRSDRFPNGMGNDSDQLGRNVMDHYIGGGAYADTELFDDLYYKGRTPNNIYIPRFVNWAGDKQRDYIRGFQYQGSASRQDWSRNIAEAKYGLAFKQLLIRPGKWTFGIVGNGEVLPYQDNRVTLHPTKTDQYGLPILSFDVQWRENENNMAKDMVTLGMEMLTAAGLDNVQPFVSNAMPCSSVHEMGTARMGDDPKQSVLNRWNQIHAVPNVFVTDGSCMTSSACQNPSLTYMAITARAVDFAVKELNRQTL